jgi:hypothetical protein
MEQIKLNRPNAKNVGIGCFSFVAVVIALSFLGGGQNTPKTSPTPTATPTPISHVVDMRDILGKTDTQITAVLGDPTYTYEPTETQISLGVTRSQTWAKGGLSFMQDFDPRTDKPTNELFVSNTKSDLLSQSDLNLLMEEIGIDPNSKNYKISPVKAVKDPSKFTGFTVSQN